MKVIIGVSVRFGILKLCHFKQLCVVLLLHFVEIFTMSVIMSHGASTGVSSSVLAHGWRLLKTQHFVLLSDIMSSYLTIVVANNIAYRRAWPVRSTVRVLLLWQINRLLLNFKIKSR